jgi:ankyrin repeat protein
MLQANRRSLEVRKRKLICLALALIALAGGCKKQPARVQTDLHHAAGKGDIETVRSLLVGGADANARDTTGQTPPHGAAGREKPDVARLLIGFGADVNAQDKWSRTPLLDAMDWHRSETTKFLINAGADVTLANQSRETPLHLAAEYGQMEIVESLIARGADVNARTREGDTPLRRASKHNHLDIIELLVAKGANVDTKGGRDLSAPLHIAAESGYEDLVQFLLDKGAQIDLPDERGRTPAICAMHENHKRTVEALVSGGARITIHLAAYLGDLQKVKESVESGADIDDPDQEDCTPLYYAAQQGNTDIARLLIAAGAAVDERNDGDPLWTAVRNGRYEVIELLLANGADIGTRHRHGYELVRRAVGSGYDHVATLLIDSGAEVSLHVAAQAGHLQKVKELIAGGADIDALEEGWSIMAPLHWAIKAGHADVAAFLLAKGANSNVRDRSNETPLHTAALYGLQDMAELLISHGADVNARARAGEYGGQSPLHRAAYGGHPALVSLLIQNGAEIDARDQHRQNPLHYAAYCGHTSVVSLLLKEGADPNARDTEEETPLTCAQEAGFSDIVALLGGDATDPALKGHGPCTEIITDSAHICEFLWRHGIDHDEAWVPADRDIEGLPDILAAHLRELAESKGGLDLWQIHVLANIRRYNREYGGFIVEGRRYVICAMDTSEEFFYNRPDNRFAEIGDGWWSVVRVIFDAEKRTVVRLECNGAA